MLWLSVGSSESGSPRLSPTVRMPPYLAVSAPAVASTASASAAAPRSAGARRGRFIGRLYAPSPGAATSVARGFGHGNGRRLAPGSGGSRHVPLQLEQLH